MTSNENNPKEATQACIFFFLSGYHYNKKYSISRQQNPCACLPLLSDARCCYNLLYINYSDNESIGESKSRMCIGMYSAFVCILH